VSATAQYYRVNATVDFHAAFDAIIKTRANALVVFPDSVTLAHPNRWRTSRRSTVLAPSKHGLEVDHQLELARLLHRQVARLRALQDPITYTASRLAVSTRFGP